MYTSFKQNLNTCISACTELICVCLSICMYVCMYCMYVFLYRTDLCSHSSPIEDLVWSSATLTYPPRTLPRCGRCRAPGRRVPLPKLQGRSGQHAGRLQSYRSSRRIAAGAFSPPVLPTQRRSTVAEHTYTYIHTRTGFF